MNLRSLQAVRALILPDQMSLEDFQNYFTGRRDQVKRKGGTSALHPPTDEVQELLNQVKDKVEERVGKPLDKYELLSYKTQLVAGENYFAKMDVGHSIIHIRVYVDLKQNISLTDVQHPKEREDEIEYF